MPVAGRLGGRADVRPLLQQPQDGGPEMILAKDAMEHAAVGPEIPVPGAGELGAGLDDGNRSPCCLLGCGEQAHEPGLQSAECLVVVLLRESALRAPAALAGPQPLVARPAIGAPDNRTRHATSVAGSVSMYTTAAPGILLVLAFCNLTSLEVVENKGNKSIDSFDGKGYCRSMKTENWLIGKSIATGVPLILWGEPGIGKSARLEAFAEEAGFVFFPVVVSHYDPSELHGINAVDQAGRRVFRAMPDWAGPEVFDQDSKALVFFDEFSTSTPAQQGAALKIFSERLLGGRKLSPKCRLIAAANPPDSAAGGYDLAAATANRFAHVYLKEDAAEFSQNFASFWAGIGSGIPNLPEPSEEEYLRARALISAFIQRRPNLLHQKPADPIAQSGPWPSRRSWNLAARLIAGETDSERILAALAATVGEAAAVEFAAFLRDADIPDPEAIIESPESAPIPERGDILYAALTGAAAAATNRPSRDRVRAVWIYLRRVAEAGHADVCGPVIRPLVQVGGAVFSPVQEPELLSPFRRVLDAAK